MKKNLLTFVVLLLSLCIYSTKTFAREAPSYSNWTDTLNVEYGLAIETNIKLTNYPNPIQANTTIEYTIPSDGIVSLKIYNSAGQQVVTVFRGYRIAGTHKVAYNALNISVDYIVPLNEGSRYHIVFIGEYGPEVI